MHTDQYEDGTLVAKMACELHPQDYPDAPDKGVEVVVMGNESGEKQMNLRYQGYRTSPKPAQRPTSCNTSIRLRLLIASQRSHAAENVLAAIERQGLRDPVQCSGPGAAQTVKALPGWTSRNMVSLQATWNPTMIDTIRAARIPTRPGGDRRHEILTRPPMICSRRSCKGVEYPRSQR